MLPRLGWLVLGLYLLGAAVWVLSSGIVRDSGQVELLNVACDPTRELWRELNARFTATHFRETGERIMIRQSHGGSSSQARAVMDGVNADLLTLALWTDTDAVRKAGLLAERWEDRLPNRSLPYTSTIVLVVRRGNPKQIRDWPDLLREGVQVVTPNPKTSGNGKWSFLALWGSVTQRGGTIEDARNYVAAVIQRVPVLDASARAATMTFSQKKIGDVHLTWENEAHLEVQEANGALEIVYPPISVLAEPHVALVDQVVDRKGTRAVAEKFLRFLYTEEAQGIIVKHHFRPTHPDVAQRSSARFPALKLFQARDLEPDWDRLNTIFFAEGGEFDRAYARGQAR